MGKDDLCSNTRWSTTQAIRVPSVTVLNLISLCHLLCLSVTAITAGSGTARKHTLQAALGCLQLGLGYPQGWELHNLSNWTTITTRKQVFVQQHENQNPSAQFLHSQDAAGFQDLELET